MMRYKNNRVNHKKRITEISRMKKLIQVIKISFVLAAFSSCAISQRKLPVSYCGENAPLQDSSMETGYVAEKPTSQDKSITDTSGHSPESNKTSDDTAVKISRTPESILVVIQSNVDKFTKIYEKYLRGDVALGGKISIKFTIAPSGNVIAAKVIDRKFLCPSLEREITSQVRSMKFEEIPFGNTTVTYAFVFKKDN